ncbi:MAG: hypothetical protein LBJ64_06865 [Deltaproteobacteria bacterium]|nr:hypothetical protein [Deltaproteobacteria bacterium]
MSDPTGLAADLPKLSLSTDSSATKAAPFALGRKTGDAFDDRKHSIGEVGLGMDEWLSGYGFQAQAETSAPETGVIRNEEPTRPPLTVPPLDISGASLAPDLSGLDIQRTEGGGSVVLLDEHLNIQGTVKLESRLLDGFGSSLNQGIAPGSDQTNLTSVDFGLKANYSLAPNWSLGASLSIRDSQLGSGKRGRLSGLPDWSQAFGLNPAQYNLLSAGIQHYRPQSGTTAALTAYAGEISPGYAPSGDYFRNLVMIELQGLEFSLQQSLLGGRIDLKAAALLNYMETRNSSLYPQARDSRNLAAYLALTYRDPSKINASLLWRYGVDGFILSDRLTNGGFGSASYLDAKIWRSFNLSPTLTLSTQLYGSNMMSNYLALTNDRPLADSYVEGRVTMSYAF